MEFVKAAPVSEIWEGEMMPVSIAGLKIVLVNVEGAIHAYLDRCQHLGVALSEGCLQDRTLVCSAHGWKYDACTGKGVNPQSARLQTLHVKIDGPDIMVAIDEKLARAECTKEMPTSKHAGPVLRAGLLSDAIIAAIEQLNQDVVVVDRGAYKRVMVPERCFITREVVEDHLGRAFALPADLETVLVSFQGNFEVTSERADWFVS